MGSVQSASSSSTSGDGSDTTKINVTAHRRVGTLAADMQEIHVKPDGTKITMLDFEYDVR